MSHLQNNSKNSNYTRVFCNYYGHHLVVICKLLHRSRFGLTIKYVVPRWESPRLDVDQSHSSLAMWRHLADTASLSLCCLQTLILVFICSFENRGMVFRRDISACTASINGHTVEDDNSKFAVSSREPVNNHSESDCLTVCRAGWTMHQCLLWIRWFVIQKLHDSKPVVWEEWWKVLWLNKSPSPTPTGPDHDHQVWP